MSEDPTLYEQFGERLKVLSIVAKSILVTSPEPGTLKLEFVLEVDTDNAEDEEHTFTIVGSDIRELSEELDRQLDEAMML